MHAASLIQHLSNEDVPVLYFFFHRTVDDNEQLTTAVRDWLAQILRQYPPIQVKLQKYISAARYTVYGMPRDDLWKLLQIALRRIPKAYFVVDGIDELDGSDASKAFVQDLVGLARRRPVHTKFIITSRAIPEADALLNRVKATILSSDDEECIREDIAKYVSSQLSTSKMSPEDQAFAQEIIPIRSSGSFLYARLAMEACFQSADSASAALSSLPANLEGVYKHLLGLYAKRPGVTQDLQSLILQLVTYGTRPFELTELSEACNISQSSPDGQQIDTSKEAVLAAGGALLIVSDDDTVSVVHSSFTEFLTRLPMSKDATLEAGKPHLKLAFTCINYLQRHILDKMGISGEQISKNGCDIVRAAISDNEFARYAAMNWFVHARRATSAGIDEKSRCDLFSVLDYIFTPPKLAALLTIGGLLRSHRFWDFGDDKLSSVTPLYAACDLGLHEYFFVLISRSGTKVNRADNESESPLCYASRLGYVDMVVALLEAGADTAERDTKSFSGLAPLHYAVRNSHPEIIKHLLENGADPMQCTDFNDPSSIGHRDPSALELACRSKDVSIFKPFLSYIKTEKLITQVISWIAPTSCVEVLATALAHPLARVNEKTGLFTPLFLASGNRDAVMVEALLRAGADATILHESAGMGVSPPGEGHNALHAWAAFDSHISTMANNHHNRPKDYSTQDTTKVFKLLVEAGANVNQLNALHSTPLHYAQDALAAKLLIESGVSVNAENNRAENLLFLTGDTETIRYLLMHAKASTGPNSRGTSPMLERLQTGWNAGGSRAVEQIQIFLDNGADPASVDEDGNTILHRLVQQAGPRQRGEEDPRGTLMKRLLAAGLDINARNSDGQIPLHLLDPGSKDDKSNKRLLQAMVEAGADINAVDQLGRTPLFFRLGGKGYRDKESGIKLCQRMVKYGARLDVCDASGRTMLHAAAKLDLIDWLVGHGVDPKQTDNHGNTIFHEMVPECATFIYGQGRNFGQFKKLVELGVDPQQPNGDGRTPLHIASSILPGALSPGPRSGTGSTTLFDWFLNKQQNVDAVDKDNVTALHLASTFSEYLSSRLLESGANPLNQTKQGLNGLHLAARSRQPNIIGMMLDKLRSEAANGQSLQSILASGSSNLPSPLYYACASGRIESVKLLLDTGMKIHNGSYQNSALQGLVDFELESKNWPDRPAYQKHDLRDVGSVTLQDNFRMAMQPGTELFERIDDILELLVLQVTFIKGHIYEAIHDATVKQATYTLDCLLQLRDRLGMSMLPADDDSITNLLKPLVERREALQTKTTATGSISADEFIQAMKYRLFNVVSTGLPAESALQLVETSYDCKTILQYLTEGGYTFLLKAVATPKTIAMSNSGEWLKANPRCGDAVTLLTVACTREDPSMDLLKLFVEHFGVDVNELTFRDPQRYYYDNHEIPSSALHALATGTYWWQSAVAMPYLIAHGADVNGKNDRGLSPLQAVLGRLGREKLLASEKSVQVLLDHGADVTLENKDGTSCVDLAVKHAGILKKLLRYKPVVKSRHLLTAINEKNPDALEALLQAGADPNGKEIPEKKQSRHPLDEERSRLPLHHVFYKAGGDSVQSKMVDLLMIHGADPLAPCEGSTLLHLIFRKYPGPALRRLMEHDINGLDPNSADTTGMTLFHAACQYKLEKEQVQDSNGEIAYKLMDDSPTPAERLLSLGADIQLRDEKGRNCVHHLTDVPYKHVDLGLIQRIITATPELANQQDHDGKTPLHLAVAGLEMSGTEIVDLLLAAGANPVLKDAKGNTVLHALLRKDFQVNKSTTSVESARQVIFERLMAIPGVDINVANDEGETPIFEYVRHGVGKCVDAKRKEQTQENLEICEAAVFDMFDAAGVQWQWRNGKGQTLIHAAVSSFGWDIGSRWPIRAKYLARKGIDAAAKDDEGVTAMRMVRQRRKHDGSGLYSQKQDVLPDEDADGLEKATLW